MFCFCGKLAKFDGKCERHKGKEPKKKLDKIGKYRGRSTWAESEGLFVKK